MLSGGGEELVIPIRMDIQECLRQIRELRQQAGQSTEAIQEGAGKAGKALGDAATPAQLLAGHLKSLAVAGGGMFTVASAIQTLSQGLETSARNMQEVTKQFLE